MHRTSSGALNSIMQMTESNTSENIVIDDTTLIRRCVKGDHSAMKLVVTKYQQRVYSIIYKICSNSDDAAELTQDTFVKVLENIANFRSQSSLYTWIYRIAVNLTLNFCKRRSKLTVESLEAEIGIRNADSQHALRDYLAGPKELSPVEIAEKKELVEIAMQALNKLSDEHRAVLVLRDMNGLSYAEIAEVLELESGTVKSRISRARQALQEIVWTVTK